MCAFVFIFMPPGVYVGNFFPHRFFVKSSQAAASSDRWDLPVEGGVGGPVPGMAGGENGPGEGNGLREGNGLGGGVA